MAGNITPEAMLALIERHEIAEGTADIPATMATLCNETFHEFQPLGITVDNRETVAELYRRSLPSQKDAVANGERKNVWYSDDGALVEYVFAVNTPDGPFQSHVVVAFGFRDGLIYSERVFFNPRHAAIYAGTLGDITGLPGVHFENRPGT